MSAFNTVASSMTDNVTGIFGMAAADVASLKSGVVAGIKKSLGVSHGFDGPSAAPTLGM